MKQILHLVRPNRFIAAPVADRDVVVYADPSDPSRYSCHDQTIDSARLVELIFAADSVVVW